MSVVVPTRDRPELLRSCLSALQGTMRPDDELVVVDSASPNRDTEKVVRDAGAGYLRCEQPGASRARNCGLAAVSRPVVAFTDDDCRPLPGWLEAVEAAFRRPDACFIFGRVVAAGDGTPMSVHDEPERKRLDSSVRLLDMGHGANMAFRVEPLRQVGGFDELLGAGAALRGAEEADVIERLLRLGCTGGYEPDAVVAHVQWRSRMQSLRLSYGYGIGYGALIAKSARRDRPRGRFLMRQALREVALAKAWNDLRAGYQTGVLLNATWGAGVVRGAWRGRQLPIRNGRYAPLFNE